MFWLFALGVLWLAVMFPKVRKAVGYLLLLAVLLAFLLYG